MSEKVMVWTMIVSFLLVMGVFGGLVYVDHQNSVFNNCIKAGYNFVDGDCVKP